MQIPMKYPLVSVALASFNGAKFLSQQLDSLLSQEYDNMEIVISDDGSTDGTVEIIETYAMRDPRIRFLPMDGHRGYVGNFMRAFRACRGELISPCDQDDIWYAEKTRRLVEAIGDASLVYCNSRFVDEDNISLGKRISDNSEMLRGSDARSLIFCTSICGHAMLFRSQLLDFIDEYNDIAYIDWFISFLAMEKGRVDYIDEVLVDWRQHENSTTFHVRDTKKPLRKKTLETDLRMLAVFSSVESMHQEFINEAYVKMDKWMSSLIYLPMFFFVLKNYGITHRAHPARVPALKYLVGYKLKRMLRPKYY